MRGLMQTTGLTVDGIANHAARWHGAREIVTRTREGGLRRSSYVDMRRRALQLTAALRDLGIGPGDTVATLAWNNDRHLETWFAIMGMGAICHTLNPRLHVGQLGWIARHAQDRAIIADIGLADIAAAIATAAPGIEKIILLGEREEAEELPDGLERALFSEDLIAVGGVDDSWGGFDEGRACGLCYTSGTTGDPKGVLYSHRSNVLHTLITLQADVMGIRATDTVLPIVPMFHANGWGLTFAAPAAGAKLVLPGDRLDGASLFELIETEKVSFAAGVPTVWRGFLSHLETTGERPASLDRVLVGGATCPPSLIRHFKDRYGVQVLHAWGMTETSPLGTIYAPKPAASPAAGLPDAEPVATQGRPPFLIDIAVQSDGGCELPRDGVTPGRLVVRGPCVVRAYHGAPDVRVIDEDAYFDTGDIATIDPDGFMQITDRAKDVIKSGGEWISSVEIENLVINHPRVDAAAAIGVPHEKWGERPLLLVEVKGEDPPGQEEICAHLEGRIARWWMPDEILVLDRLPVGATGKIDKKLLRAQFADHLKTTAGDSHDD